MKRHKSMAFFADRSVVTTAVRDVLSAKPYRGFDERIAERWILTSYEPSMWHPIPMHVLISEDDDGRIRVRAEMRPGWLMLNAAGFDPVLRSFLNAVNERLNASAKCVRCGYDLRHADHAKCPECGKPIEGRNRT